MSTTADHWCYSHNEENYYGKFDSFEEAAHEGLDGHESVWVGEAEQPTQPEFMFDAGDWIERVSEQDEYSHEAAHDWDRSTKEQREELEAEVRAVMAAWLDRHGLRPNFFIVNNAVEIAREEYEAKFGVLEGGAANG